jgi:hypothetical protein
VDHVAWGGNASILYSGVSGSNPGLHTKYSDGAFSNISHSLLFIFSPLSVSCSSLFSHKFLFPFSVHPSYFTDFIFLHLLFSPSSSRFFYSFILSRVSDRRRVLDWQLVLLHLTINYNWVSLDSHSLGPDPIGNNALALFSGQPFPSNAFFLSCLSSRYKVTSTPQAYMSQYIPHSPFASASV